MSERADRPMLLVLRALGLGDLLTGVPALRALRRAYPHHRLVLALPEHLHPLALRASLADRCLDLASLDVPITGLRSQVDVAVNLHGRGPESHRVLVALDPHRLLAFARPDRPGRGPCWWDDEHERARWCRMLAWYGIDGDPDDLVLDASALDVDGSGGREVAFGDPCTIVHPGAAAEARRWPVDRWAAVARSLQREGHRVLVTGGPDEQPLAAAVVRRAGLPVAADLAGRTSVVALAALVASARLVLSGDTGIAHLATAFRTPSVVLFGPVPPASWGPPAHERRHRALWRGRTGDPHASTVDAGLLEIRPPEVVAALRHVLAASRAA